MIMIYSLLYITLLYLYFAEAAAAGCMLTQFDEHRRKDVTIAVNHVHLIVRGQNHD